MPTLYNIEGWDELFWFSTGGTRDKKFLQSPEGKKFYFKQSYRKEVIDYRYEFWSEIIAAEIGRFLGFIVLQYDLATDGKIMGCICQSMIENDEQELNEGGKYLQAFDNTFEPEDKSTRNQYSFQLIQKTFEVFSLEAHMDQFIQMLVFDALIGNSDRHQENWAFITTNKGTGSFANSPVPKGKDSIFKNFVPWMKKVAGKPLSEKVEKKPPENTEQLFKLYFQNVRSFSPIYDSGSSLGRELTMEKVSQMLTDKVQLEAYLRRGMSEVHWEGKKINHFDFLKKIQESSYAEIVNGAIKQIIEKFDEGRIRQLINAVDEQVPDNMAQYKLPEIRKDLIFKLVTELTQPF